MTPSEADLPPRSLFTSQPEEKTCILFAPKPFLLISSLQNRTPLISLLPLWPSGRGARCWFLTAPRIQVCSPPGPSASLLIQQRPDDCSTAALGYSFLRPFSPSLATCLCPFVGLWQTLCHFKNCECNHPCYWKSPLFLLAIHSCIFNLQPKILSKLSSNCPYQVLCVPPVLWLVCSLGPTILSLVCKHPQLNSFTSWLSDSHFFKIWVGLTQPSAYSAPSSVGAEGKKTNKQVTDSL